MKGYWQREKKTESEIGKPIMNSNSEEAESNREISDSCTWQHGGEEKERKSGRGDCENHLIKLCQAVYKMLETKWLMSQYVRGQP